jgi:hypothetical protein
MFISTFRISLAFNNIPLARYERKVTNLERIGRVVVVALDIFRLPVVLWVEVLVHLLLAGRLQQR